MELTCCELVFFSVNQICLIATCTHLLTTWVVWFVISGGTHTEQNAQVICMLKNKLLHSSQNREGWGNRSHLQPPCMCCMCFVWSLCDGQNYFLECFNEG